MKFLITFTFLAAAASLGLAKESATVSHAPHPTTSGIPTIKTDIPASTPTTPLSIPGTPSNQTDTPLGNSNSTDSLLQVFANTASKTANDPITELLALSPQCQAALFSIVASPEFLTCIPIPALLPLLPVLSDPKALPKLLKDPVHTLPPLLTPVFDGICAAPKCSDKGVAGALQAVQAGCKKDVKSPLIKMITGVITFYSPVRDSICFKTNKKEYCVFDTLEKVFSIPKPPITITGSILDNIAFAEPKLICTPCNKAIVNTIFNYLDADKLHSVEYLASIGVPQGLLTLAKLGVAIKCGFQFLDGDVGHPEKTDPNDFEYQVSLGPDTPVPSGASNLEGFGFVTIIGAVLASTLMI